MTPGELAVRSMTDLTAADRKHAGAIAALFLQSYDSERTRSAYATDLSKWFEWCAAHDLDPLTVRRPALDLFAREAEAAGRSRATVARRLSVLSAFYRYAEQEGVIEQSPAKHVRRPKINPHDSTTLGLDRDEVSALLDAAEATGPRDHAVACLLALSALRVSEVCAADVSDVTTERGHRIIIVTRKGGSRAKRALAPRTVAAIEAHLRDRTAGPLLLANDGTRLDRFDVTRIVRRLARAAGIDHHISPHSLRHAAITLARQARVPLEVVQDFAGHADPRTTRRYDRARHNLDEDPTYTIAAHIAEAL